MIRGEKALAQHLARRLYVAVSWYQYFGNDSRPLGNESWYSFEKPKRRVASACFELEECSLESRWVEPFVRRPYAHETGEAS
jgi:hypothetical protein